MKITVMVNLRKMNEIKGIRVAEDKRKEAEEAKKAAAAKAKKK